jgi:hypothetical protein
VYLSIKSLFTSSDKQSYTDLNVTFICPCIANIIPNYNQQDATFLDLFISTDPLHVSGGSSSHHQEHINMYTASGIAALVDSMYSCMYSFVLLMMGGGTA